VSTETGILYRILHDMFKISTPGILLILAINIMHYHSNITMFLHILYITTRPIIFIATFLATMLNLNSTGE